MTQKILQTCNEQPDIHERFMEMCGKVAGRWRTILGSSPEEMDVPIKVDEELTIDEKLNIIGNEYDIPIEENFRKDVSVMCNLSQGIEEKGIAIGEARKEEKIILNMHNNGFTVEQIAMATDKNVEEVKAIIAGKEPALA